MADYGFSAAGEERTEVKKSADRDILVSVIMPAYKCEKTIEQAVESVLSQDVPLELIVLNDCSPDDVDRVMKRYKTDSRVIYIKNKSNLGASRTRNKGVEMARGKYIAFLDSDDWWAQGKLKKQLSVMMKEKAPLCCTARELVSTDGRKSGRVLHVPGRITYKILLKGNVISCSSVVIRSDIAREFPMSHEESHEDYIMWMRVLRKYGWAVGLDEPLLLYRVSNQGKSGSKLKSAKMTYMAYRFAGLGRLRSCYCFCWYAVNGVRKYFLR